MEKEAHNVKVVKKMSKPLAKLRFHTQLSVPNLPLPSAADYQNTAEDCLIPSPKELYREPFSVYYAKDFHRGDSSPAQTPASPFRFLSPLACIYKNPSARKPAAPHKSFHLSPSASALLIQEILQKNLTMHLSSQNTSPLGTIRQDSKIYPIASNLISTAENPESSLQEASEESEAMNRLHFDKNRRSSLAPTLVSQNNDTFTLPSNANSVSYCPCSLTTASPRRGSNSTHICGQVTATPTFGVLQSGNNIALSIHIPQQRRMSNSAMNSPLSPLSPSTAPTITGKRRNKAVFIIDAVTTQILIASDSVCRVFALKDRSMIGKRFKKMFPTFGGPTREVINFAEHEKGGPRILQNVLFDPNNGELRPVYGKVLDIIDADGQLSCVSVWSYPLTNPSSRHTNVQRKVSANLLQNHSPFHLQSPVQAKQVQLKINAQTSNEDSNPIVNFSNLFTTPPNVSTPKTTNFPNSPNCPPSTSTSNCAVTSLSKLTRQKYRQLNKNTPPPDPNEPVYESASTSGMPPQHTSMRFIHEGQQQQDDGSQNRRWLILMEPINALFASVILGDGGRIFRADDSFASILGYDSTNRLFGTEIHRLIPALNMDAKWDKKEQFCCGSTLKNNGVPFSILINTERDCESGVAFSYEVQIRSLSSINGVVTLTDSGLIYSFNENFFHQLLGMEFDDHARNDQIDILDILPHFYEYLEVAHFYIERHKRKNEMNGFTNFTPTVSHSATSLQDFARARRLFRKKSYGRSVANSVEERDENDDDDDDNANESDNDPENIHNGFSKHMLHNAHPEIIPGIFYGLAKHIDGNLIPVKIEVTNLDTDSQPKLFAVCIGFDRSTDYGISQHKEDSEEQKLASSAISSQNSANHLHPLSKHPAISVLHSSTGSIEYTDKVAKFSIGGSSGFSSLRECDSDSAVDFITCQPTHSDEQTMEKQLQNVSINALEDENSEAVRGEYSKLYNTFQLIGNGAFGSVKLAARKETGLLAVSKFVCKSKVLPESWVPSPKRGNKLVPIEVHLLEALNHPNIVRVLDVFENDNYYQLVMEKLGCGMDLFEFIDHQPLIDEPLMSYIFRQIISAVEYLHENHIVHRDLKDENVIIDQCFCCKLIDFGSAAYFGDNIVFSTFCGTMEYCSPEVLTGNKYLGPELEMWSLGILLYTLAFSENPFRSAQETVKAQIELPWEISEGLYQVLSWLLQPDPKLRATVGEIRRHWWMTQRVDTKQYKFQDMLRNCDRAQVDPPLYVTDLHNRLKNVPSCGNLAGASTVNATISQQESGAVSAR